MSQKYTGGFITKSPVAPTSSAASGIWTLDQQQQAQKAGTWPSPPIFIEDLFSTYLYTGTGAAQTIVNGIDLSGQGGLVWMKNRSLVRNHNLYDTVRGAYKQLRSDSTGAQITNASGFGLTGFNSNGFSLGDDIDGENFSNVVSWTFREQPKFFDIVTYSGSNSTQTISHNLGSAPGCIMIKKLDSNTFNAGWAVYHRSLTNPNNYYLVLNTDAAETNYGGAFISSVSSTTFTVAGNAGQISLAGSTYVAYLFAHDAGGFPVSGGGSTNGITCGSYTGSGGVDTITLGYEPQWILMKATAGMPWRMFDTMRGMSYTDNVYLDPSTSDAEVSYGTSYVRPTPTGFTVQPGFYGTGATVIYIAIRRGPMKTPTVGTSVFAPNTATYSANQVVTTGFPIDMMMMKGRTITLGNLVYDRLRGIASTNTSVVDAELFTSNTDAEGAGGYINTVNNTGYQISPGFSGFSSVNWNFRRAPGFMDVVCYTGNGSGSGQVINHNLGVTPELIIIKSRSGAYQWHVYAAPLGQSTALFLESTSAAQANSAFTGGTINSTQFQLKVDFANVNGSGVTYVSYLFATCPGVSKVGSYTGTGAAQTINCGFTSGARFVLIKRTDSTGNWNVWDSARGIIPANDPYLSINLAAVEVTGTDYVDTTSVGFDITSTAPAEINANGGTFLFLAIA
jgi:hypothetical protein